MPVVETDLRIRYRLVGDGPPVLWHTGGCGDGRMWELGGYLVGVPGFTHIVMDHRGRGGSDAPVDMSGHHMACYVADVVAVRSPSGPDTLRVMLPTCGRNSSFPSGVRAPL